MKKSNRSGVGIALSMSWTFVAIVGVFAFIGYLLDAYVFSTSPAMLVVGLVIGFVAGVMRVVRVAKDLEAASEQDEDDDNEA